MPGVRIIHPSPRNASRGGWRVPGGNPGCLPDPGFSLQGMRQLSALPRLGRTRLPAGTAASNNGAGSPKPSVTAGFTAISPCSASLHFF